MNWDKYGQREAQRNSWDKRVQVIRCQLCHRLRAHPKQDDVRTWNCGCGGMSFFSSFPHPDEEQLALKLYAREIEENRTYSNIVKEILDDGRAKHPLESDMPERKRIYFE